MGLAGDTTPTYTDGFSLTGTVVTGLSNPGGAENAYFYGQTGLSYYVLITAGQVVYNYVDNDPNSAIYTNGTVDAETAAGKPNGEVIAIDYGEIVNVGILTTYPLPPAAGTNNDYQKTTDVVYVASSGTVINYGTIGDLPWISKASNTGTPPYGYIQWDYSGIVSNGGSIDNEVGGQVTGFNAIAAQGIGTLDNYGTIVGNNDGLLTSWDATNHVDASLSTTQRGYADVHTYADFTNYGYLLGNDYALLSGGNYNVINDYAGAAMAGVTNFDGSQVYNGELSALNDVNETPVLTGGFANFDAVDMTGTGSTLDLHAGLVGGTFYLPVIEGPLEGGFAHGAGGSNTLVFGFAGLDVPDLVALEEAVAASHVATASGTYYSGSAAVSGHYYQWDDFADVEVACFAAGTRIATPAGQVPVEALRAGDAVRVAGAAPGEARVRWVGHRRVVPASHPRPDLVQPVRIARGAFADGVPHRALLLSPDHAVFLGGALIPIKHLVNGHSIARMPVRAIEYWHVELDRHDILLAEGLAAESYLDTGNRGSFAEGEAALCLHPDFAPLSWADACAELVQKGPRLIAAKQSLFERAGIVPRPIRPGLLVRNGENILQPRERSGGRLAYIVPGAAPLRLTSPPWVPAESYPDSLDHRTLGVRIFAIAVDGLKIPLDDPMLGAGFHPVEQTEEGRCRWTDGDASLALPPGGKTLVLTVGDGADLTSGNPAPRGRARAATHRDAGGHQKSRPRRRGSCA